MLSFRRARDEKEHTSCCFSLLLFYVPTRLPLSFHLNVFVCVCCFSFSSSHSIAHVDFSFRFITTYFFFSFPWSQHIHFRTFVVTSAYLLIFPSPNWWCIIWNGNFLPIFHAVASSFYCSQKSSHEMKNRQNIWMSVAAIAATISTVAAATTTMATTPLTPNPTAE